MISLLSSFITSHVLIDLFRPRLKVSSKFFQVVFVHLVYISALFYISYCCSFSLHVVANLIIFLVSPQLVLLSTLPIFFFHSFCGQTVCTPLFFWKISIQVLCSKINGASAGSVSKPDTGHDFNQLLTTLHLLLAPGFWTTTVYPL